jgi:hypothetical protein
MGSGVCVQLHHGIFVGLSISITAHFSLTAIPCFFLHSCLSAKHAQKKAAKWAEDKRPKKSRLSDIFRAPIVYELHTMVKPAEYTVSDAAPVLAVKPAKSA